MTSAIVIDYSRVSFFDTDLVWIGDKAVGLIGTETIQCGPDLDHQNPCKVTTIRTGANHVQFTDGLSEDWYVELRGTKLFARRPNGNWIELNAIRVPGNAPHDGAPAGIRI